MTAWQPPNRLVYLWHLAPRPAEATEVEINFAPVGPNATRVDIDQAAGAGAAAPPPLWRERNQIGWDSLLPHYVTALSEREA